jgi:hypothetical protein
MFCIKLIDSKEGGVRNEANGNTIFGFFNNNKVSDNPGYRNGQVEVMGTLDQQNPTKSTGTIIDDTLLEFRQVKSVKNLTQALKSDVEMVLRLKNDPFLSIYLDSITGIAKKNAVNLNIIIKDAEAKDNTVTLKQRINLVTDPYDKIEFVSNKEVISNVAFTQATTIQINFSQLLLSKGNAPEYKISYGT